MTDRGRWRAALVAALFSLLATTACSSSSTTDAGGPSESVDRRATTTSPGAGSLADARIKLQPVAELTAPVALAARPATSDLYIAGQGGQIWRLSGRDQSYELDRTPVLDLRDATRARGEQGLLGLTFSPDGNRLYVDYTDRGDGSTHIVEYTMDGARVDAASARELLHMGQPYPNHNGGQLAFGPDGYLYIGMGDGGSGGDPGNRAQNPDELLGKILRIDPLNPPPGQPYAVPADNPFAAGGGRPEIWLVGVRNPWRFSFDRDTGDLWVADVGQDQVEEVSVLPATDGRDAGRGANLGWPFREGNQPFKGETTASLVEPVHTYTHADGNCSITGGFRYRGRAVPSLVGVYLYGDYCRAEVRGLTEAAGQQTDDRSLGVSVAENSLSSFGQDLDGELFVLSTAGTVYRVAAA